MQKGPMARGHKSQEYICTKAKKWHARLLYITLVRRSKSCKLFNSSLYMKSFLFIEKVDNNIKIIQHQKGKAHLRRRRKLLQCIFI
jgi:hypothetical protein